MHKARLKSAVAVVLLVGVCAMTAYLFYVKRMRTQGFTASKPQNPQLAKSAEPEWAASFLSALEERTSIINLPRLKESGSTDDDLEMRYWYDARPGVINGFVIRRVGSNWSALGVRQASDRWPSPVLQEGLGAPRSVGMLFGNDLPMRVYWYYQTALKRNAMAKFLMAAAS